MVRKPVALANWKMEMTLFDPYLSQEVRLAYGDSVSESYAQELLALPELDGLGAARKGRDPGAFAGLVRLIAKARPPAS